MPTIEDVAKRAGVSIATVSRYYNDGYVSKKSREKIEAAVKELGYRVNPIAQALMKKSSKMIGLILPSITNPFFPELAKAVEHEIYEAGFKLLICNSEGSPEKEADFISALKSILSDGIITATGNCSDVYEKEDIPVVSIDRKLTGSFVHVTSDNKKGAILAIRKLYESGCRKITFVRPPLTFESIKKRNEGVFEECSRYADLYINTFEIQEDSNGEFLDRSNFYDSIKNSDGIFAWNDATTVNVLRFLFNKGINVPGDKMLIGFDDIYLSREFIPSITTVRQKIYEMGSVAARCILHKIGYENNEQHNEIILDVELVERDTTINK